jgi:hypothetical protein
VLPGTMSARILLSSLAVVAYARQHRASTRYSRP